MTTLWPLNPTALLSAGGANSGGECVAPAGNNYIAIAAGGDWQSCPHSLALKSDGSIVGWGDNSFGECNTPAGNNFIAIATGSYNSITLVNTPPIAAVGPNQIAYAWIDDIAEVTLDASASYDEDGDELTYLWRWSIDGNDYEANGVSPTIELPVGMHTIELVVNDGWKDSEPNQVVITVVEPIKGTLSITPQTINRQCEQKRIMATLRLPEGITKEQIDSNSTLLLYPGEVEAISQRMLPYYANGARGVSILAFFDRDEILEAIGEIGTVQVYVVGQLKTGQYFYCMDTIRIVKLRLPAIRMQ